MWCGFVRICIVSRCTVSRCTVSTCTQLYQDQRTQDMQVGLAGVSAVLGDGAAEVLSRVLEFNLFVHHSVSACAFLMLLCGCCWVGVWLLLGWCVVVFGMVCGCCWVGVWLLLDKYVVVGTLVCGW